LAKGSILLIDKGPGILGNPGIMQQVGKWWGPVVVGEKFHEDGIRCAHVQFQANRGEVGVIVHVAAMFMVVELYICSFTAQWSDMNLGRMTMHRDLTEIRGSTSTLLH